MPHSPHDVAPLPKLREHHWAVEDSGDACTLEEVGRRLDSLTFGLSELRRGQGRVEALLRQLCERPQVAVPLPPPPRRRVSMSSLRSSVPEDASAPVSSWQKARFADCRDPQSLTARLTSTMSFLHEPHFRVSSEDGSTDQKPPTCPEGEMGSFDGVKDGMKETYEDLRHLKWEQRTKARESRSSSMDQMAHATLGKRVLKSWWFDNAIFALIVLNSAVLGAIVHIMARDKLREPPLVLDAMQMAFGVIFLLELLFRVYVLRGSFFTGPDFRWNIFDLVLVVSSLVEFGIEFITKNDNANDGTALLLRAVRLLRVVRLARMIKVIRFFKELRVMVFSVLSSLKPLIWAIMLLWFVLYLLGLYLTQAVTNHLLDTNGETRHAAVLEKHFANLYTTIYYLLQCVTNGISWGIVSDPLLEISWWYCVTMSIFTCFTFLALLNIITGVFVDGAIRKAQKDKEAMIEEELEEEANQLRTLEECFGELDADGSGYIDLQELEDFMANPRAKAQFRTMGLSISKAYHLFRLLDMDNSGTVSISEFTMGCMRMTGTANNLDIATLMYENKRMMSKWVSFFKGVEEHFHVLHAAVGSARLPPHSGRPAQHLSVGN